MGCQATKEEPPRRNGNGLKGKNRDVAYVPAPMQPKDALRQKGQLRQKAKMRPVLAFYNDTWYTAVARDGRDSTVDVFWGDGTFSKGVGTADIHELSAGAPLEALWGNSWYPCKLHTAAPAVVIWEDGTAFRNIPDTHIRPPPVEPLTPIQQGIFGRRPVLVAGTEVEVRDRNGYWNPAIMREVGDLCHVQMATGENKKVPLSVVRVPPDLFNQDLN